MGLVEIRRQPWYPLRSDVTADDTFLTTFEHDNSAYTAIMKEFTDAAKPGVKVGAGSLSQDIISPVLAFWGKAAEDTTALYKLYGRRRGAGPIELIAAGQLALGADLITKDPTGKGTETARWVDTITQTIQWVKPVTPLNSATAVEAGALKAYLGFNGFGLQDIAVMFDLDGGTGSDTTEMNCILTGA